MAAHNDLGKNGEQMAADYLLKNGYEILQRNWTFQKSEIDIIARKNDVLAVVEVKTRSSLAFGLPQDFINPKKIQHLVKAVNEYVVKNDIEVNVRFDIVAISKHGEQYKLEHLEDAFLHF